MFFSNLFKRPLFANLLSCSSGLLSASLSTDGKIGFDFFGLAKSQMKVIVIF